MHHKFMSSMLKFVLEYFCLKREKKNWFCNKFRLCLPHIWCHGEKRNSPRLGLQWMI